METLRQDAAFALKLLMKQKAFTIAALLTLALCIGANTAMFSVVNSVLLRPLPFPSADRLVHIYNSYPGAGAPRGSAAVPDYYDRLEGTTAFSEISMVQVRGLTTGDAGRPERLTGMAVTPSFFRMLGIPAQLGRTFTPEEGEPGAERQAVLSWGYWQEQYAGARDVIGRSIRINEQPHTIVGVMPKNFAFMDADVRLWVPLAFPPEMRIDDARHSNSWNMIAALKPGMTVAQGQAQIDALNARNNERFPAFRELLEKAGFRTVVVDYQSDLIRDVKGTLWLLQGGVLLVLLIGCVNVANLVLVRSVARQRELATRSAMGAEHRRLVAQLVTEGLLLALIGGALGAFVAWGMVRGIAGFATELLPRGSEIVLDGSALLAAFALSLFAGLLFSAIPVARLVRADLSVIFREEGRTGSGGRSASRWRAALVVAQVSIAFALLVGAGLMIASFAQTLRVDMGFDPEHVLSASVALPPARYPEDAQAEAFNRQLLERLRRIPGVEHAATSTTMLFGDNFNASVITVEGYVRKPEESIIAPFNTWVSEDYFTTMDIELVRGREFTVADAEGALPVAIIDEELAQKFWPGKDPLGQRIAQGTPGLADSLEYRTIVGVARNVRAEQMTGDQAPGHYYMPLAQDASPRLNIMLRTSVDPATLGTALRSAVAELDPDLPAFDIRTMEERVGASLATQRLRMLLLAGFGGLALFLAAIGLYGVLAYSVLQRSAEIGIRMALGSPSSAVFGTVVRQGARLVIVGLGIGLGASLALTRLVASMLYDVAPTDPLVFGGVSVVLGLTALAACVIPARRAMRVDPLVAIREER